MPLYDLKKNINNYNKINNIMHNTIENELKTKITDIRQNCKKQYYIEKH